MSQLTAPRQVKLKKCVAYTPGLEDRGVSGQDKKDLSGGLDISNYISQINIYESIFDNTISGQIIFTDILGLLSIYLFVGVEYIFLTFATTVDETEVEFSRIFQVVGLRDQTFVKNQQRMFTVDIVTPEFVQSISNRVQSAYNQVTCSDAIRRVLTEELGVAPTALGNIENTSQVMSVTIPNYTPLTVINYFTMLALNPQEDSCFLFYETLGTEGFHFTSLRKLFEGPVTTSFNVNAGQISSAKTVEASLAFNSIVRLYQDQAFNVLVDIAGGMLRSRVLHLDILARKYRFEDSNYTDAFDQSAHLDDNNTEQPKAFPLYPKHFDKLIGNNVKLFTVPSTNWTKDSKYIAAAQDQVDEERLHKSVEFRNRQIKSLKHIKTVIELPGSTDIHAGAVVVVNYPSSRALQLNTDSSSQPAPEQPSTYYSGKHLVTSVRHMLTRVSPTNMEYMMHIEVCRDALSAPLMSFPNISSDN